mmetsp:Transcript_3929/g.14876  ORF Transcript_3929/g.14876 Transcript_3929/m.14876 type:complete len:284 (-) Transcript_3929:184-1035(-)|eukprot:CAMPEP_0117435366 /NCGR_PEP_ID=MMETSP0759-20121206/444_1 /TAXON_ID=63605 /ORGANISM="Percolomonas cosmopolitus, Strain WS" /LENGTH=283 /DNA_ID=CAMNT_0005226911 /DNA_START=275 /DNA_END=1126 /DNA_ORIENTATION=+
MSEPIETIPELNSPISTIEEESAIDSPAISEQTTPKKTFPTEQKKKVEFTPVKTPAKKESIPEFDSVKDKLVWKMKRKVNSRKAFSKLSLKDIALWKNPIASAALFVAGQLLFYMLCRWQLTLALVVGRVLVLQILICFAYVVGMKLIAPNREVSAPAQFDITPENVREYLTKLSDKVYTALAWYVSVLLCKDFRVTVAFGIALEVFNRLIAKRLGTGALIYLGFNAVFILPVVYELFEDEIQKGVSIAHDKVEQVVNIARSKFEQFTSKTTETSTAESKKDK